MGFFDFLKRHSSEYARCTKFREFDNSKLENKVKRSTHREAVCAAHILVNERGFNKPDVTRWLDDNPEYKQS